MHVRSLQLLVMVLPLLLVLLLLLLGGGGGSGGSTFLFARGSSAAADNAFLLQGAVHVQSSDLGLLLLRAMKRIDELMVEQELMLAHTKQIEQELTSAQQLLQQTVTRVGDMELRANRMEQLTPSSSALVTAVLDTSANVAILLEATPAFKNRLFNGDMAIDTTDSLESNIVTDTLRTMIDGWQVIYTGTPGTVQTRRAGNPLWATTSGLPFMLQLDMNPADATPVTSTQQGYVLQQVPAGAVADLLWGSAAASPVTLSFWIRQGRVGTWGGSIRNMAGTRSFPFSYTISTSERSKWVRKAVTIPGDTCESCGWKTSGNGHIRKQQETPVWQVAFTFRAGSDYLCAPSPTWQTRNCLSVLEQTQTNEALGGWLLAGVQLEKGTLATGFDLRPYNTELMPTGSASLLNSLGNGQKNRLLNGAFNVDQLFRGAVHTITANGFVIDRWLMELLGPNTASLFSVQQMDKAPDASEAPPPGFMSYLAIRTLKEVSTLDAMDSAYLMQKVEFSRLLDLNWGDSNPEPLTLSFHVRSSVSGLYTGAVRVPTGTRTFVFTYTVSAANVWQKVSVLIPADTISIGWGRTAAEGDPTRWVLHVMLNLLSGSSQVSSSFNGWITTWRIGVLEHANLASSANNAVYFTGVQLERSLYPTVFDARPASEERRLVQRYMSSYGFSSQAGGALLPVTRVATDSSNHLLFALPLPSPMRRTPTLSISGACVLVEQVAATTGAVLSSNSGWTWTLMPQMMTATSSGQVILRGAKTTHGLAATADLVLHCPTANDGFHFNADV